MAALLFKIFTLYKQTIKIVARIFSRTSYYIIKSNDFVCFLRYLYSHGGIIITSLRALVNFSFFLLFHSFSKMVGLRER